METVEIDGKVLRDAVGIRCPACKTGYAERVRTNTEEQGKYGCHRDHLYECCARAFICLACGARSAGRAEAPEME